MNTYDQFADIAEQAARRGGDVLSEWSEKFTVSEKSRANLVTEADFASQEAIHGLIKTAFPDHGFLGEEDLSENDDAEFQWVIDPLDGTSNYVHGFPYYCVSIGLEQNGKLIVGVIFDPNRNEMFRATKGGGATLNGKPIKPSDASSLEETFAVASLPVGAGPENPAMARFMQAIPHLQTVQRTGSAALNLAYVACSRIDAYWSTSLKPWDVAAGSFIVQEAGGMATDLAGEPIDIRIPSLLASNGSAIHADMVRILK
jgi:myo-inositol-1(or 4)-monophosphatase